MVEVTPYTIPEGEKYMDTFIKIYTKTYWWSHRYSAKKRSRRHLKTCTEGAQTTSSLRLFQASIHLLAKLRTFWTPLVHSLICI